MADKFAFRGEKITGVALRTKEGAVHSVPLPAFHADVYTKFSPGDRDDLEAGFTTNKREFVNREQAMVVAKVRKQTYTRKFNELDAAHLKPPGYTGR